MADFDLLGQLEASFNTNEIGIVEFAESPQYCNRILYPRQKLLLKLFFLEDLTDEEHRVLDIWESGGRNGTEIEISPGIRERTATLKSRGYKHFREVVLVGGRRCSKGFVTGISLAKLVNDCLQLQDPARHYGIDPDKEIIFSCVAASQNQAQEMQYADFSSMVNSCHSMQRHIFKLQEREFSLMTESDIRKMESWKRQNRKVQRDISKIRGRALPANSRTIRGSATMAIVFDEFAHFMQGESDQSDQQVYGAAVPALAQFGRDAMIFCNSSPYSKVGTFYERFELGLETDNGNALYPEMLSVRFPSWALFEGWWEDPLYRGPKKCITVSPDWDMEAETDDGEPFYTEADREAIRTTRNEEKADPEKFKVERRGRFAEVIDAYLIPEMIDRAFAGRPLSFDSEKRVWTYQRYNTNWDDSTYRHKYYAHLDPSSTTAGFGFSMGHIEVMEIDGKEEEHVVFDIIKRWLPKRDFLAEAIDWEPILDWLVYTCDLFRPVQISFDQFNSDYPISWLRRTFREKRIETRVFQTKPTAQTNWDRAEIFRTALYRGFIHAPNDTQDAFDASEELKYLQEIKTGRTPRVEKQDIGPVQTKDMADCMMEVVQVLIGDTMAKQQREGLGTESIRIGAPGGYPLGGLDRGGYGNPKGRHPGLAALGKERMDKNRSDRAISGNPARRAHGGRPLPRRLPGW